MKQLTQIIAAAVILIFTAGSIQAQEAEDPLLIVSSQKVKMSDMGAIGKMMSEKFGPILNSLVDDEFLFSFILVLNPLQSGILYL